MLLSVLQIICKLNHILVYSALIMPVCRLAALCFCLFLTCSNASLTTYRGALNDCISSLRSISTFICCVFFLQTLNKSGHGHVEFKAKLHLFISSRKSQGLLLWQQNVGATCEISSNQTRREGDRVEDERAADGERMRERDGGRQRLLLIIIWFRLRKGMENYRGF